MAAGEDAPMGKIIQFPQPSQPEPELANCRDTLEQCLDTGLVTIYVDTSRPGVEMPAFGDKTVAINLSHKFPQPIILGDEGVHVKLLFERAGFGWVDCYIPYESIQMIQGSEVIWRAARDLETELVNSLADARAKVIADLDANLQGLADTSLRDDTRIWVVEGIKGSGTQLTINGEILFEDPITAPPGYVYGQVRSITLGELREGVRKLRAEQLH